MTQFYEANSTTITTPELFYDPGDLIVVSYHIRKGPNCDSGNEMSGSWSIVPDGTQFPSQGKSFLVETPSSGQPCNYATSFNYIVEEPGSLVAELVAGTWTNGQISVSIFEPGGGGSATTSPYIIDVGTTLMLGALLAFFIAYWIIGLIRGRTKVWS